MSNGAYVSIRGNRNVFQMKSNTLKYFCCTTNLHTDRHARRTICWYIRKYRRKWKIFGEVNWKYFLLRNCPSNIRLSDLYLMSGECVDRNSLGTMRGYADTAEIGNNATISPEHTDWNARRIWGTRLSKSHLIKQFVCQFYFQFIFLSQIGP